MDPDVRQATGFGLELEATPVTTTLPACASLPRSFQAPRAHQGRAHQGKAAHSPLLEAQGVMAAVLMPQVRDGTSDLYHGAAYPAGPCLLGFLAGRG